MSAVLEIDRRQGGSHAERHLEQRAIWASHDGRSMPAAPLPEIVELLQFQSHEQPGERSANVREVAAAAGQIIERLDDLFDERPDALARLVDTIDGHAAVMAGAELGSVEEAARLRLAELQARSLHGVMLIRAALVATDELRQVSGSVSGADSAHLAVEHGRLDELKRLLDAGWNVNDPTSVGMTLLHHAIDVEVDSAAQSGDPLSSELTELLVARGASLSHRWHGKTPLEAASERDHHLAVEVIESAVASDPRAGGIGVARQPWWAIRRRAGDD